MIGCCYFKLVFFQAFPDLLFHLNTLKNKKNLNIA